MIYLDNASTTQVDPEVLDAMMPYLKDQYGNPGTIYSLGRNAKKAIETAREQVADFIGAEPHQIIFTSGGTEANNMVFSSLAEYLESKGKKHIITSAVEHDSVLKSVQNLCTKSVFYKTVVGVDENGCVDPEDVEAAINDNTGIASIMCVNNEIGSVNDVEEIANVCREREVLFHTDCVQAAGCCDIDVNKIGCDFLSLSAHKIHGVKGCGALFAKSTDNLNPLIIGGASQEFGLRGGTENVPAIVGFGKACELMKAQIESIRTKAKYHKDLFIDALRYTLCGYKMEDIFHINGNSGYGNTSKILNIRFDMVDAETLLLFLDSRGVFVSAGSACRSLESQPSHVLTAIGVSPDDARNSIRVSFSKFNTADEVETAAIIIAGCVRKLLNGN